MGHSLGDGIIVAALAGALVAYLYFKHVEAASGASRSFTRSAWRPWRRAFHCRSSRSIRRRFALDR